MQDHAASNTIRVSSMGKYGLPLEPVQDDLGSFMAKLGKRLWRDDLLSLHSGTPWKKLLKYYTGRKDGIELRCVRHAGNHAFHYTYEAWLRDFDERVAKAEQKQNKPKKKRKPRRKDKPEAEPLPTQPRQRRALGNSCFAGSPPPGVLVFASAADAARHDGKLRSVRSVQEACKGGIDARYEFPEENGKAKGRVAVRLTFLDEVGAE